MSQLRPRNLKQLRQQRVQVSPFASEIPLEDLQPFDTVNDKQPLPDEAPKVEDVYEWAWQGLTNAGIAGKCRMPLDDVKFHYSKTIANARADRALDELQSGDLGEKNGKSLYILSRVDPVQSEATVEQQVNSTDLLKQVLTLMSLQPPSALPNLITRRLEHKE